MDEATIIDNLERTLDRLTLAPVRNGTKLPGDWAYEDWTSCAAGHIYAACTGRQATVNPTVYFPTGDVADTMVATARALGWEPQRERGVMNAGYWAASFLSLETARRTKVGRDDDTRMEYLEAESRDAAREMIHSALTVMRARTMVMA